MSIVVQKYGGSSVADASRLRQVADRVMRTRREGHEDGRRFDEHVFVNFVLFEAS